jgi:hypothetical protein
MTRVVDYIITQVKVFFATTETEKREIRSEVSKENFEYPEKFGQDLLTFSIALAYSVMCPLILPVAFIYFIISYIHAKYHFVFVCNAQYEYYEFPPFITNILTVSILIFQLTMTGVFALKVRSF